MNLLASVKVRLFLVSWILFSLHWATNVVREHYPAFSLVDKGTFQVDEYEGLHPDIFRHRDGHCYVGNQVAASVVAAVPLFIFDPVLDTVERWGKARPAEDPSAASYASEYPNRREFLRRVREKGWDLRFGAATAVTTVFLMAVLSAAMVLTLFAVLEQRGLPRSRAAGLALLFGFGTPLFYRTGHLSHNLLLTAAVFWSFCLLWRPPGPDSRLSAGRRWWAGFLAGTALALDYAGVIPLAALGLYLLVPRARAIGLRPAIGESLLFVAGSLVPIAFLLYSQWSMYGDPFLPGQYWMPAVHYTDRGFRGFAWPAPDLFLLNLFSLDWGLFTFGPLLLLAFWRPRRPPGADPVLPRRERIFVWSFALPFLLFCAANQYSRMQWNTGFRYLLPLVPFLFLAASDVLRRLPRGVLVALSVPVLLHSWVLAMVRFTAVDWNDGRRAVTESWRRFLTEGPQLPWLKVLAQSRGGGTILGSPLLASALIAVTALLSLAIWRLGARAEAATGRR